MRKAFHHLPALALCVAALPAMAQTEAPKHLKFEGCPRGPSYTITGLGQASLGLRFGDATSSSPAAYVHISPTANAPTLSGDPRGGFLLTLPTFGEKELMDAAISGKEMTLEIDYFLKDGSPAIVQVRWDRTDQDCRSK